MNAHQMKNIKLAALLVRKLAKIGILKSTALPFARKVASVLTVWSGTATEFVYYLRTAVSLY